MIPAPRNIKRRFHKDEHTEHPDARCQVARKSTNENSAHERRDATHAKRPHRESVQASRGKARGAAAGIRPTISRGRLRHRGRRSLYDYLRGGGAGQQGAAPLRVLGGRCASGGGLRHEPRRPGSLRPGCRPGHRRRHRPDTGERPELPRRPRLRRGGHRLRRLVCSSKATRA